jgi:hypothetical protein
MALFEWIAAVVATLQEFAGLLVLSLNPRQP